MGDSDEEALRAAMDLSISATNNNNTSATTATKTTQDAADHAAALRELEELEAQDSTQPEIHQQTAGQEWEEEMVPVPVNEDLLNQLIDMGFPDARARKGLVHGGSLDGALVWIGEHQEDADIDQPYMVRKSDTIPKPPLTAEEKAQKIEQMKNKIKTLREEREKVEKVEEVRREKERRERGQKMDETVEERQRLMRKREAEKIKREKDDALKERARLKAEIARDKEIRKANKGVLPSVLGVDGYNPSIIQYDVPMKNDGSTPVEATTTTPSVPVAKAVAAPSATAVASSSAPKIVKKAAPAAEVTNHSPEEKVEQSITTICKYRTGGAGGNALKLLVTFIKNIVENPEDPKYRSINTESAAYKSKIAPLVGPLALLKTLGFEKDENDGKLKFGG